MIKWAGPPSWSVLPSVYSLFNKGLGIFGGAIADRFGAKPMIVTGMLLMRAAGFATMGIAHEPLLCFHACFRDSAALFDPPRSALVVKLIRPQQRGRFSRC